MLVFHAKTFSSKNFTDWARMAVDEWEDSIYEDLVLFGQRVDVYVGQEEAQIVAGCFLSKVFVNVPVDFHIEQLLRNLQAQDYLNLSYMIVHPDFRGKGLCINFLKQLSELLPQNGFWLECDPPMVELYRKSGFFLVLETPSSEGTFYMSKASLTASSAQPQAAV